MNVPRRFINATYRRGKLRLELQEGGFTLWDEEAQRWIIDASTLEENGIFVIGMEIPRVEKNGINLEFEARNPPMED